MPSVLPDGEPAPADGSLPRSALEGLGTRPFGFYVHVPFCTVRCGYCDFNTYTADRARRRPGASPGDVRRRGDRRDPAAPAGCSATPTCRSRRSSSAAARRPCCRPRDLARIVARDRRRVRPRRRAPRSPPRPTRTASTAADLARLRDGGFNRVSFGMQSAVPHVLARPRPHPRPARVPQVVRWAREAGLRAGQPRPDLRHAGGVARRLADLARRRARLRARPRLGVRADRRGRHRAGPADPPRRGPDARRRRPRRQVPRSPTRRSSAAGLRLVRGVQLGPRRRRPAAGTTSLLLDRRRLVGRRARARTRTSAACAGGTSSTPTPYAVRHRRGRQPGARRARCSTRRPGGSSGCCWRSGCATGCRSTCSTTPAGPRVPAQVARGLVEERGWRQGRLVLTTARPAARRRRGARPAA